MSSALPEDCIQLDSRPRCYQFDPTEDPRWKEFVERHPKASVFHTVGWLQALSHTYKYEPVAFTTSPPASKLTNGIVFCRVESWLTGRRLVSLPFSDHCEPLCDTAADLSLLIRQIQSVFERKRWKYLAIRPCHEHSGQLGRELRFIPGRKYFLHRVDLRPNLQEVFGRLDKDCVQRRIQRAEKAGLIEKCGRSGELLKEFYRLFVITRQRHNLPPTPYVWFRNLIQCQGDSLEIRVAFSCEAPVAAILTLRFRDTLYYKYGCSDVRFNKLGATPWLLWRAISAAKVWGATEFDMGRTEQDNAGLLTFKNHWAPVPAQLVYWSFPALGTDSVNGWKMKLAKRVFAHMPKSLVVVAGRLLYRHIG